EHHFSLEAQREDFEQPPLREFAGDDTSLKSPRFRSYVQARPATDTRVRTFMTFSAQRTKIEEGARDKDMPNNDPAFIEWNPPLPRIDGPRPRAAPRMRGKVVLFTSTLNVDWSSWPGSPSFGAMMQEVTRFAMTGRLREQASLVGTPLEEYLASVG